MIDLAEPVITRWMAWTYDVDPVVQIVIVQSTDYLVYYQSVSNY